MTLTSKRILLSAAAVLVALFIGLLLLLSKSHSSARVEASPVVERVDTASSADSLTETEAGSGSGRTYGLAVNRPSAVAARVPPFPEAVGLRLVVVGADDRKPAAGAEVRVWERTSDEVGILMDSGDWIGPDFESFMTANGRGFVTDENGEVDVPSPSRMAYVCARLGDGFGWSSLDELQRGLAEIRLLRTHALLARVSDRAGIARANVRVAFGRTDDGQSLWEAPTNAKGEVRIPAIEVLTNELGLDEQSPFALRLCIPEQPRVEHWLTLADLPSDAVEFTLPATGSVHVEIVDETGQIVPLSGSITLRPSYEDALGRARLDDDPGATKVSLVGGVADVQRVGLGLLFDLSADLPGTGDADVKVRGPSVEGETVAVAIPLEGDHTLLTGRLVDETGKPLANATFDWRRMLDDDRTIVASGRDKLVTNGEGRFSWTLRRSANATGPSTHRTGFICELTDARVRRQATVRFSMEYAGALSPLGDIVLVPGGPLIEGRVVDSADVPVADARVFLHIQTEAGYQSADTFDSTLTAADGTFTLYGPCLSLRFGVEVTGATMLGSKFVPFTCTDRREPLVIRVDSAGGLEGTALIDRDAQADEVVVSFTADMPPNAQPALAECWRAGDRLFFRITKLTAGTGTVRFHMNGIDPLGIQSVPRVVVGTARVSRPPELVDVDLRGKLPKVRDISARADSIEFTIVDTRGRPIPRGLVSGMGGDGERQWTFGNGRARVEALELRSCESAQIWAPGCRVAVLEPPFLAQRVVLAPELDVEFRLEVPKIWRDAKIECIGSVSMLEMDPPQFEPVALARMQPFRFDARGHGRLALPVAGQFSVYVLLWREGVTGLDDVEYGIALEKDAFVVHETDGLQVVELVLDPEAVRQCNEDLGLK